MSRCPGPSQVQHLMMTLSCLLHRKAPQVFLQKFFPRELHILSMLRHPNIIHTYEVFENMQEKVYIVMELAPHDLLDFIKKRQHLSDEVAKRIFKQMCLALNYCHDLNIAHRDLKCENVLLDKDFNVKLCDFGFSRQCDTDAVGNIKYSKTFCGSKEYAAPEVTQGIPYDPKMSDAWSMGVVLFIMVCGFMPYNGSKPKTMLRLQKDHRVNFPKTFAIPKGSKDLILKLLHPCAVRRPTIEDILRHWWVSNDLTSRKPDEGSSTSASAPKTDGQDDAETADGQDQSQK
uniref:non-specific serine/threonine protein kinase n=1 Tax=Eptatretus burgeri TaxID=7764 RepID=A0A8C4QNG3_EPTBU